MSSHFEAIIYEKRDFIARLTLNRPQSRNSLNMQLMREMCEALEDAEQDRGIGVIVITGSGDKIFCPGLDLPWAQELFNDPHQTRMMVGQYGRMIADIRSTGKPVIARVNGLTAGGGCELVIHSDLAIAAEHARFQQGEGGVGAIATYATQSLTPVMGEKKAKWFLFTDELIDARTALNWGLVNKVVPYEQLDAEIDKLCKNLLNKGPRSLRFTKAQTNIWFDLVAHTIREGDEFWTLQSTTSEPLEGIAAFLEKREPQHLKMRGETAKGKATGYLWGPPTRTCPKCNTRNLPADFDFCGKCGAKLV